MTNDQGTKDDICLKNVLYLVTGLVVSVIC